jgi:threonylcarbamoyladenosine tRNA methylthiotransferase MtaB
VPKVIVQSFGCRASQADGAAIEAALKARGYKAGRESGPADLVVVNTCTVTRDADVDARRAIRGLHREHPEARILVTGCYAQRAPQELAGLEGVHWVVGNSHKAAIAEIVAGGSADYHGQVLVGDWMSGTAAREAFGAVGDAGPDRTRPILKVQDGCSNRCSFCIIPAVRGRSRSAPLETVVAQVRELAERYCEVVLSGINLGRWGRDFAPARRFPELVQALLKETEVGRLRISSVEPMDWSEELLRLMADEPRVAKHAHMPLQSGSDAVLKRMFRKYRTRHYASRVELARRLMPEAAIGADVMTGFPGETEAEFRETVRFVEEQPFTYLHVFTYSERPGTAAADAGGGDRGDAVPVAVRRERTRLLRALSERKNLEFRRGMIGKTLSAVTLEERGMALTTNYLKVALADVKAPNRMADVTIGGVRPGGLVERGALPIF